MANRYTTQFTSSFHKKLVIVDCNFVVDNSQPTGIRNLKGGGIAQVYMNSLAAGSGNPNPAPGLIFVRFMDNYYNYYLSNYAVGSPPAGQVLSISASTVMTIGQQYVIYSVGTSTAANWQAVGLATNITPAPGAVFTATVTGGGTGTGTVQPVITVSTAASLTVGAAYVITSLGTTTTANWQTLGLPTSVVPAVGQSFIAAVTAGTGTGTVQQQAPSGIDSIEVIGNPVPSINGKAAQLTIGTQPTGKNGPYMMLQTISDTAASFTASTNSSTSLTTLSSFAGLQNGQAIFGAGIPLGTTITAINQVGGTVTISQAATATATLVPMTATPSFVVANPANGTQLYLSFNLSNSSIQVQGD